MLFEDTVVQNADLLNMSFKTDRYNIFGNSVAQSRVRSSTLDVATPSESPKQARDFIESYL